MVEMCHTFRVSNSKEKKEKMIILEKKLDDYDETIRQFKVSQDALKT